MEFNLDALIDKFGGWTEEYAFTFLDGTTEVLRYDPKEHVYFHVNGESLDRLDGVTSVCHIIDKSEALIPWACKMMGQKLMATVPIVNGPRVLDPEGLTEYISLSTGGFEKLVNECKTAHKEKLEDAGAVGHAAHDWIERYIKWVIAPGENAYPLPVIEERAAKACKAALDWMQSHNVRWLSTERKIYSRAYGYAGTMDGLCVVDSCNDPLCCPNPFKDRLTVADWKTSNYLYPEYLLQTAAYMQAFMEETGEPVEDRWVIRLGKDDGEFDPWHAERWTYEEDWEAFRLCLMLTRQVRLVKERIKLLADGRRLVVKAAKKLARDNALALKCTKADKYKGVRATKCNGTDYPCEACRVKYESYRKHKIPPEIA